MQVLAFGGLDVYAARGEYQLVVELIEPKGLGALQAAFEQLKRRLEAEGLFDDARKRPLPAFPRTIAIVTSPTGAAIRDMLNIIGRRFGDLRVLILPVRVQGDEAPLEIVAALAAIAGMPEVDVVIVGRGGGSIEDLWAFNDERVARAIAACPHPVISAVGHETDFTIADFVADLRAPTPSAAAELVVREKLEVIRAVTELYGRLCLGMAAADGPPARARGRAGASPRAHRARSRAPRVDAPAGRRGGASACRRPPHHRGLAHRAELATNALSSQHPLARISNGAAVLAQLRGRLGASASHRAKVSRHRFSVAVGRLQTLSPLAVLGRGYSLTRLLPSGTVVRSAAQARVGDAIEILLAEGALGARVNDVKERDDRHQV